MELDYVAFCCPNYHDESPFCHFASDDDHMIGPTRLSLMTLSSDVTAELYGSDHRCPVVCLNQSYHHFVAIALCYHNQIVFVVSSLVDFHHYGYYRKYYHFH
jgi:hypothetical protein